MSPRDVLRKAAMERAAAFREEPESERSRKADEAYWMARSMYSDSRSATHAEVRRLRRVLKTCQDMADKHPSVNVRGFLNVLLGNYETDRKNDTMDEIENLTSMLREAGVLLDKLSVVTTHSGVEGLASSVSDLRNRIRDAGILE